MAARVRSQHPKVVWSCPALPPSPREATAMIRLLTESWPSETMAVIGSSLGGFYARWLCLQRNCRAVLLNPAPHPQRDLTKHIGEHPVWQNPEERIYFRPEFVDELSSLSSEITRLSLVTSTTPDRVMALISEQDEVLDWREMLVFCAGASVQRLPDGNHAIDDFEMHLDAVIRFLQLKV